MRVLIAVDAFPVVSQTFITLHCAALLDAGVEVEVVARCGDERLFALMDRGAELSNGFIEMPTHVRLDRKLAYLSSAILGSRRSLRLASTVLADWIVGTTRRPSLLAFRYASVIREFNRFDIVHAHFGRPSVAMAQLKSAGVLASPLMVTFHGADLNAAKSAPNKTVYRRVFREADWFTTGTRHMARHLDEAEVPTDQRAVIPMGAEIKQLPFRRCVDRSSSLRLATLGRLIPCKGTEFALRALKIVRENTEEVTLDVIGDGPLRGGLERLADELGIADAVRFHGALPHKETLDLLGQADIYVHPGVVAPDGTREGQGVALIEAQALGLPVIASRVGGIPEATSEGRSTILVDPGDPAALADAIVALGASPSKRREMGALGRQFVEDRFDQSALTTRWIELYESVIAASR